MPTVYPGAIDIDENRENDAVGAIEITLGSNPQGTAGTVGNRIARIEDRAFSRHFYIGDFPAPQAAIDAAHAAGGGYVVFPWGETLLPVDATTRRCLTLKPGVNLVGHGGRSVLKVPDGAGKFISMVGQDPADDLSDCLIAGLVFHGNATGNPVTTIEDFEPIRDENQNITGFTAPRVAVWLQHGARMEVTRCRFTDADAINTVALSGAVTDGRITNCHFDAIGASPVMHDHSTIYTHGDGMTISGNILHGVAGGNGARTAIETHGSGQQVVGNRVSNFWVGFNLTGCAALSDGVIAALNQFTGVQCGILIWSRDLAGQPPLTTGALRYGVVADNVITRTPDVWTALGNLPAGIQTHADNNRAIVDVAISNNVVAVIP